jgi:hypothetical protein
MAIIGIVFVLILGSFLGLKYKYQHTVEKHCVYMPRLVSDLGPPEKVCPRVCERQNMEYDTAFSYLEKKLGTECACCGGESFSGKKSSDQPAIP